MNIDLDFKFVNYGIFMFGIILKIISNFSRNYNFLTM